MIGYDETIVSPVDTRECAYCLTFPQAQALMALAQPLAWKTRWYSETDTDIDQDTIDAFASDIIRRLMVGCCCDDSPNVFKWVGNVLYVSHDGGVTFEPSPPSLDYRNTSTTWPKPGDIGISNTKCQAADGVVFTIKEKINTTMTESMTAAEILGVIAAALLIFLSAGTAALLEAQFAALGAAIVAAGVTAYQAAFTTDVWNKLRCLVYCNMTDDSTIDQAGVDAIYAAIDGNFTGIVVPALKSYIGASGLVGINNMLRSNTGDPDANCDDCECIPPAVSFYTPVSGWRIIAPVSTSPTVDIYEVESEIGGGENRVTILGGQTPSTYPGTVCVPIRFEILTSPTYDYRTTYDCSGTASGSHGTPVPDGNYTQADLTRNPELPLFTIRFKVYRDPIP